MVKHGNDVLERATCKYAMNGTAMAICIHSQSGPAMLGLSKVRGPFGVPVIVQARWSTTSVLKTTYHVLKMNPESGCQDQLLDKLRQLSAKTMTKESQRPSALYVK